MGLNELLKPAHGDVRNNYKQETVYILTILFCATVVYNCFAPFRVAINQAWFFRFTIFPLVAVDAMFIVFLRSSYVL